MSASVTTTESLSLASDFSARPAPVRAVDFGGKEQSLIVGQGMVSDRYTLAPAHFVQVNAKQGTTAADLDAGRYSVAKIGAEPQNMGEAPDMTAILRMAFNREHVELGPFVVAGVGHVHVMQGGEDPFPIAVFEDAEGRKVGLNRDFLDRLTEGAQPASDDLPAFFGRQAVVRYRLQAENSDKVNVRPIVVTRELYSRSMKVSGKSEAYISATWQALLMPVRLGR